MRKPSQQTARFYRPELDLLRFFAFLLVFLHHGLALVFGTGSPVLTDIVAVSAFGLQVFFFLSAFLLTELLLREREATGSIHVAAFFMRRGLRIWPLYFLFLLACLAVTIHTHKPILPPAAFAAFALLAGNWYIYLHDFLPGIAGPLWSISLEEQFYLCWPFLAAFGTRVLRAVCVLLVLAAAVTLLFLGHRLSPRYAVWTHSLVEFQFFALGAWTATGLHKRPLQLTNAARLVLLFSGCLCLFLAAHTFPISRLALPARQLLPGYALLDGGVTLVFLAVLGACLPPGAKPLVYLGRISYGLYVFHVLALHLASSLAAKLFLQAEGSLLNRMLTLLLGLVCCTALASVSYYALERPFIRLKRRFTFVRSRDE